LTAGVTPRLRVHRECPDGHARAQVCAISDPFEPLTSNRPFATNVAQMPFGLAGCKCAGAAFGSFDESETTALVTGDWPRAHGFLIRATSRVDFVSMAGGQSQASDTFRRGAACPTPATPVT
jgi:hypothetical protein